MPNKNVAYIEGEERSDALIYALADEITGAAWNGNDGAAVVNRWTEVFRQDPDIWVTYKEMFRPNVAGIYKHTDGTNYPVYTVPTSYAELYIRPDADGFLVELATETGPATGKKIKVVGNVNYTALDATTVAVEVQGLKLANVPDGVAVLAQSRKNIDNTVSDDAGWNEFQVLGYLDLTSAGDWDHFLSRTKYILGRTSGYAEVSVTRALFTFTERYYVANPVHFYEKTVVLKSIPDNADGSAANDTYFVMLKHPKDQYNYFDVYYGKGFVGTVLAGDPKESYIRACDPATVIASAVPTIVNQKEAEAAYLRQSGTSLTIPSEKWMLDLDGITEVKSPPSHYHYGADSVVAWVPNKKRRPDYLVSYYVSVSNNRVAIILEGDPSPDNDGYYRSFGYIGRIIPFNQYDNANNFAITVGMGDLVTAKTGFVKDDIMQDANPKYAGWGRYTSNGMYSVSMFATRANVLFQAHYPAFITELPNYPSVGTIPTELSRLIIEKNGFQASSWTDRYHGSPIYLAHQYEGYRGYMDSVIAINDHNLINLDELVVDTEEAKPGGGTWTEVYKFFSLNSPISMFDLSANPNGMTVAILKEVK